MVHIDNNMGAILGWDLKLNNIYYISDSIHEVSTIIEQKSPHTIGSQCMIV